MLIFLIILYIISFILLGLWVIKLRSYWTCKQKPLKFPILFYLILFIIWIFPVINCVVSGFIWLFYTKMLEERDVTNLYEFVSLLAGIEPENLEISKKSKGLFKKI